MELTPIAAKVFSLINVELTKYLYDITDMMQINLKSTFISLTALYIVCIVIFVLTGKYSMSNLKELGFSALILCFIGQTVLKTNYYIDYMVIPFIDFLIDTASWFASKGSVNNFLDIFKHLDSGFALIATNLIDKVPDGSFLTNANQYFYAWFAMFIFGISYGLMYIAFLSLIILSLFIIHVLFVLGIFCIFLASFKETRFVFWSWFRAIANYSMIIIFAAIVMSVGFKGIESSLALYGNVLLTQGVLNGEFAALVVWSLVCFAVLLKVPDLAGALSGGSAGSTTGIVAGMSMAGGATIAGMQTAGRHIPSGLSHAYSGLRGTASTASKWVMPDGGWGRKGGE